MRGLFRASTEILLCRTTALTFAFFLAARTLTFFLTTRTLTFFLTARAFTTGSFAFLFLAVTAARAFVFAEHIANLEAGN